MITIQSKFAQFPQSMCEYQASKDGRFGWLLSTSHPENDFILEEIQTEIKLEILNSRVLEISKMEIEKWLKEFFADFHWKLHARLRKTDLKEKGISLFFAVIYDESIYFVQFGRIFCASTKGKKINAVGKTWKHYQVQTLENLSLFGLSEEDIRVKPQHLDLPEQESLIILPGSIASRVFESGTEVGSLLPLIESFSSAKNALGIVLKNVPQLKKTKKHRFGKLQISTSLLLLATLLTILYMAFGKRFFEVSLDRTKKEISSSKLIFSPTEVIEKVGKILNYPARSIEFKVDWTSELDYEITAVPAFSLKNIYLASGNNLIAYDKKSREQLWQHDFEEPIISILSLQTENVICTLTQQTVCLDPQGNVVWSQTVRPNHSRPTPNPIIEITTNEDKRIDHSISVIPLERGLSVLDSQTGAVMSELKLNDVLRYVSDYDDYDFCFYAVVAKSLICIKLNIVN